MKAEGRGAEGRPGKPGGGCGDWTAPADDLAGLAAYGLVTKEVSDVMEPIGSRSPVARPPLSFSLLWFARGGVWGSLELDPREAECRWALGLVGAGAGGLTAGAVLEEDERGSSLVLDEEDLGSVLVTGGWLWKSAKMWRKEARSLEVSTAASAPYWPCWV